MQCVIYQKKMDIEYHGGTSDGLYPYVANRWGLEYKQLSSSYETLEYVKKGWMVVIACGEGLWTTGGHFILAVGYRNNDEICIYDPYLYAGKFDRYGRQGKVSLEGTSAYVQIDTFKAYSNAQRFHAFNVNGIEPTPTPEPPEETKVAWVNTQSLNLNVRNAPNGDVIGSLPKGTQVLVYEVQGDWARIGNNKWVANSYLTYSEPVTKKTMYVNTSSLPLNVRDNPNGNIVSQLPRGTTVVVVGESNGWSHIDNPVNGWVSSDYLSNTPPQSSRNTVGETRVFKDFTYLWSNPDLTGTRYEYKANTTVEVIENTSSDVDKVKVIQTGRVAYVNINAYTVNDSNSVPTPAPAPVSTVGEVRRFNSTTYIYSNSNLTGTKYTYKANTSVKILENVSSGIDKVYVIVTGRVGYVSTSAYK